MLHEHTRWSSAFMLPVCCQAQGVLMPSGYWDHEGSCMTVLNHNVNASEELNHDVSASEVQTTCQQVTHVSLLDVCHNPVVIAL